jgi:hypothetical protein
MAIDIKDELEADGLLYCKHRLILHNKDNRNGFKQMFQCTVEYQVVAGNNVHQNIGQVQEGGTGMAMFGETTGHIVKTGLFRGREQRTGAKDSRPTQKE